MTRRHVLALWLLAAVAVVAVHAEPDLSVTSMARDGQLLVSFELNDGFTAEVRDAIQSGLATTFQYDIELRRSAATWFDKTIAELTITTTVRFDNLTRRYRMSRTVEGRVEDARPTEDQEAMRHFMTRFAHVPLSMTSALDTNGEYYVRIRAHAAAQQLVLLALGSRIDAGPRDVHVYSVTRAS